MEQEQDASSLSTGYSGVDEAVAAIGALGDADLATHVATFERAHDALRAALTSPIDGSGEEEAHSATEA